MRLPVKNAAGNPAVNIQKKVYSMAATDGTSAEITMYGDIYEQRPIDWLTNQPIEGNFILLDEFLEDLKQIESCKNITIRMNSYGGDAGASNTIHNRLRELARNGAELTCIVDGVAMSGGSIIMCACDTVRANPSSLIMIHKSWTCLWGGYNADELREQAAQQDAWDKMQSEIYQRKTGLSNTVIMHMMSETTYMTGREAAEKGFVDELLEDASPIDIAASDDGRSLFIRGRQMHLAPGMFAPDNIPTMTYQPENTGRNEGGNLMTTEELREQYPDAVAQIEAAARDANDTDAVRTAQQAERARIAAIDEVAALFDPAMVQEAKYGENPCTAEQLAYQAARKAAANGRRFLVDMEKDAGESGTALVSPANNTGNEGDGNGNSPAAMAAQARADVQAFQKMKEGK